MRGRGRVRVASRICDQIVSRIGDLGISQAELARRVGMQPSHLNRFLKGHGDIRALRFIEILNELGFDLEALMARPVPLDAPALALPDALSGFERRTLELLVSRFQHEARDLQAKGAEMGRSLRRGRDGSGA